jgi:pimeloyl-ACP methyl ester carboxylesterase
MKMRRAAINGTTIAYDLCGRGPPLVLIMGYRLNSRAWPSAFIEALAQRHALILFDNRGTGLSDKPVSGYAIRNMAEDVRALMDHLGIETASVLGYSMGGAVAQELACRHSQRIRSLILCATLCGGRKAVSAGPSVIAVMRDLEGLAPAEAARRIWSVTYEPRYLAANLDKIEQQMQREIENPTPLHAADLQFQAFADFDIAEMLPSLRVPTLIITGDSDMLIPPKNSEILARLIVGARLEALEGCGHRVIWEATDRCVSLIGDFLEQASKEEDGARAEAG